MACCTGPASSNSKITGQLALSFNEERKIAKQGMISTDANAHVPYPKELSPFYRMTPSEFRPVRFAASGVASEASIPKMTISQLMKLAAEKHGNDPAMKVERDELPPHEPTLKDGGYSVPAALPVDAWNTWTWKQYYAETRQIAKSLIHVGLKRYDGVSIFGFNAPEWFMAQISAILGGGLAAGIYPTDTEENVEYKLRLCNAVAVFVEDASKMKKVLNVIDKVPTLKAIITYLPSYKYSSDSVARKDGGEAIKVYTWEEFKKVGEVLKTRCLMIALMPKMLVMLVHLSLPLVLLVIQKLLCQLMII